ncbi:hypothetical protein F441_02600 [Phytophthora nicotianae CJ01A1]|uniref:RxLR effector protein n=6 Tax=Phytophthora nicotianae TaxID=4792 RepID=W2PD97_PHYN3|nr:hypothetical protein PPTG_19337 [Phytophthora nicotianae INRA-310]ETI54580.1 hypothetical protein F443_02637 [Phytophthora nicotianae P1569]ETK94450.1 hypothetical protein L915_02522 [Phytophthora nicotianae]ETO83337.1 hypothetical protein F444_02638 [Phytophthora nicotianae P1976]ETP24412.1 hypothetical protein F441_02600 [Phytophthora nicotianae CJ01A1]ETP52379.1 hypothetical protein F442_02616 [Phytophthora nicotianae P10297]KUF80132.1 hypothetical protein AM587_10013644 [Phytophthora n
MMQRSSLLLVVVAFVAGCVGFITAENSVRTRDHPSVVEVSQSRNLKSTSDGEEKSYPIGDEERGMTSVLTRIKSLLVRNPTKMSEAKNNVGGANDYYNKVNSIIGEGKTSTKLTPDKVKQLETLAHSSSDKWWAMAYFTTNVLGVGLMVWFVYGTLVLGWRPYGMGGSPRANN